MASTRLRRARLALVGIAIALAGVTVCLVPQPAYAAEPLPVLLVHGYDGWGNSKSDWLNGGWIADGLAETGHGSGWAVYKSAMQSPDHKGAPGIFDAAQVYSLDYHGYHDAKGPLRQEAGILAKALEVVTKDSGATSVYVVAHSQGGLMTRALMEEMALDPSDNSTITYNHNIFGFTTVDTPHKGSRTNGWMWIGKQTGWNDAAKDILAGSDFLKELNAGSISDATFCSVVVGNAKGEANGDGLFSADEQTPIAGTVPSSTEITEIAVVHGEGDIETNPFTGKAKYETALDSQKVKDFAIAQYRKAAKAYQERTSPADLHSATAIVMDVSGSMGDMWHDGVKIESAKRAANDLTAMIEGQADKAGSAEPVSVAAFSESSSELSPLRSDYGAVRSAIGQLSPMSSTNIGAGIATGLRQLQGAPRNVERIMILLSDGQNNTGMSNDEIIAGPVADAANVGVRIYTIGFGDPGDIDEDFLKQVAAATGGQYFPASDAMQLAAIYIKLAVKTNAPNILAELSGTVAQGEKALAGSFEVTSGAGQIESVLNWPGSVLDLKLTDPKGTEVGTSYPGLTVSGSSRPLQVFIDRPMQGTWQVGVYGREVSSPQEPYYVLVASKDATQGSGGRGGSGAGDQSGLLFLLLALPFAGLVTWTLSTSKRKTDPAAPLGRETAASLYALYGEAGLSHTLRLGLSTLGRAADNDIVLDDPTVSRHHAVIEVGDGVTISDLNSTRGTFVNGKRVERAEIRDKDTIGLGDVRVMLRRKGE